jgi:hypothetical protein
MYDCPLKHLWSGRAMRKRFYLFVLASVLLSVGFASAQQPQYPIMDKIAQKVVQKYRTSSCQQLAQEKSQPPTGQKAGRCNNWRSSAKELNDPER